MANPTAANTVAGKPLVTGGVLYAPVGTPLPTDPVTALNAAFLACGYSTDKGLSGSEKRSTKSVNDWGGDTVAVLMTGIEAAFKFGFLEFMNSDVAKAIYGASNVTVTAATAGTGTRVAVAVGNREAPHWSWVFAMGTGSKKVRVVVPDGQITEVEDTDYKTDDLIGRNVTLTAYPDAAGNYFYVYTDDGVLAAGTVPIITGVFPSAQTVGKAITLQGSRFTGTTALTVGGVAVTSFNIISDTEVIAVMPAGTAGSAPVIATNAGGASASFAYTRG